MATESNPNDNQPTNESSSQSTHNTVREREVIVTDKGGTRLSARQDHEIGRGPANPMSGDELWQKFRDCAGRALPEERIGPLFEMLGQFETLASLAELTTAIEFEGAGRAQRAGQ